MNPPLAAGRGLGTMVSFAAVMSFVPISRSRRPGLPRARASASAAALLTGLIAGLLAGPLDSGPVSAQPSATPSAIAAKEPQDRPGRDPVPFDRPDPADREDLLVVATVAGQGGPLFALSPIAQRLGGRMEVQRGDSYSLTLRDRTILFGPEIETVAIGGEIVSLREPPRVVEGEIYVPMQFLQDVYGRLANVAFTYEPGRGLRLSRGESGRVTVSTDVVHLQGVTTVVLEFSARPRYRIVERPLGLDVVVQGAAVQGVDRRPEGDPLVERVEVRDDRISLDLSPGTRADSYTLDDPFRIVFDLVRGETGPRPGADGLGTDDGLEDPFSTQRPVPPQGLRTIVLDPGHGGSETGAIGPSGVEEKALTLLLARALKSRLESALGVRVVLTRDEDANLPHATRTAVANQNKADLFISLHLNSAFGASARGAETYFLSTTASDERAARSAEEENRVAASGGAPSGDDPLYDLQLILWDLAQTHFLGQSQRLAGLIQGELNSALELRDRGVKQAPFVVLMGAAMPAVLVEAGFISNPEEEQRLQDPAYRGQLADALVRAIGAYKAEVEGRGDAEDGDAGEGDAGEGDANEEGDAAGDER